LLCLDRRFTVSGVQRVFADAIDFITARRGGQACMTSLCGKLYRMRRGAALLLMLLCASPVVSEQVHRVDPASGAATWEIQVSGVSVSLTQILPDQARAFYVNRGFPPDIIEPYARACVYMTVLRNDAAPGVVHFRLADWEVVSPAGRHPPLSVDSWLERLQPYRLDQPLLIAFRWAQFPPEQAYEPGGDWNQGMLTMGLPAGAQFDLIARWDIDGKAYEGVIKHVDCAP